VEKKEGMEVFEFFVRITQMCKCLIGHVEASALTHATISTKRSFILPNFATLPFFMRSPNI
jgi:hypothetical protein